LAGAIDQIATLSASAPAPVAESVELVALVQSAVEETTDGLRKDASAGRIKIDWQRPNEQFIAELDASLVRKGLGSILASACKASAGRYGNPTQEVVVTLQVFSQSAVLKISDNGPPRSEDNLQWVFHRIGGWLESGSNRTTSVDLSCLGQHIVRAGGYVSAFVDSSKRTTFQIVFTSKSQIGYPVHGGATGS
jgi:K+-sensing histidine kinase KdpD